MAYLITLRKPAFSDTVVFREKEIESMPSSTDFRWTVDSEDFMIKRHLIRSANIRFSSVSAIAYTQSFSCEKSMIDNENIKEYLEAYFLGEIPLLNAGYYN